MSRVEHDGVICFARAGDRVRTWRNETGAESDAPPPIQLARALVHPTVLPTAMVHCTLYGFGYTSYVQAATWPHIKVQ